MRSSLSRPLSADDPYPIMAAQNLQMIRGLKPVLRAVLLGLALMSAFAAVQGTALNLEKLQEWSREPATVISLARDGEVEIEVARAYADSVPQKREPDYCSAHESGNACLLLPRSPFGWYSLFDEVDVVSNPKNPGELEILNQPALWNPISGYLILAFGLAFAAKLLRGSAWGEDRTWSNGAWIATETATKGVAFGRADAESIREPRARRKAVLFWSLLFFGIACFAVPGALMHFSNEPVAASLVIAASVGIALLAVIAAFEVFTRRLHQDSSGLCDATLFSVKRVAWSAIGSVALVNVNREAQRRFDRSRNRSGMRPATRNAYVVSDKQGRRIIRLEEHMEPEQAHRALLARLRELTPKEGNPAESVKPAEFPQAGNFPMAGRPGKRKSIFHPEHRGLLLTLLLMLSPFVFILCLMTYRSLWFLYAAERVQGQVVEVKRGELPSLVIEYSPGQGRALRIQSDGTDAYGAYEAGDTITVFYAAGDPENARIDLFLEIWLGPIVMGVVTSIVFLLAVLIVRAMTAPWPGS